jgi:signal transduction histidine kinase/ActR/RegA family two-component response regulator
MDRQGKRLGPLAQLSRAMGQNGLADRGRKEQTGSVAFRETKQPLPKSGPAVAEWTFQRKLFTGVTLICLLAILTSAASLIASRSLIANMANIEAGEGRNLSDARALQLAGVKQISDVQACLLTGGREFAPAVHGGSALVRDLLTRLESRVMDPGGRSLIDHVRIAEQAHQEAFARELIVSSAAPGSATAHYPEAVLLRAAQFNRALLSLVAHLETARLRSLAPTRAAMSRAETLLIVITTATLILLVVLCMFLIAALTRSFRFQQTATTVAERGQSQARESLSEAEAASHLKDEFLATVSHELRNPLAPILTWTQLLRSGTLDEAKSKRALEVIERNVLSQAQLIDDLVDVSRVASGKFRLDVRPIDLVPVIKAAAEAQTPASEAKQIRLQLVLDERAGLISGDSERLQQVMWNLISNAIKFTPKGGRVQVVLQRAESHLEIAVSDTGTGIDAGFLPHIFEPFRQGTGGSMRRHGGLGLGLSIVRHIVELHGGEIAATSGGPDKGSRFTIKFPLLATAGQTADLSRRHPIARDTVPDIQPARLDGTRVLVVDDESTASEALHELFLSCGADARVAGSAVEALVILDDWHPDVLVSDIAMPGEDGYSLIRKIRLRSPELGGRIPAVALTAYAQIEDRVTILGAGFQMYLSKPADPNELVAVVGSLVQRPGSSEPADVT